MTTWTRRDGATLAALTVLAAGLRLWALDQRSFWVDEMISICHADAIRDVATFLTPACGNAHPPLFFLLLKGWLLGGRGEAWTRILPALGGVALVPATFWLIAELGDRRQALLASGLVAVSPFLLLLDRELRMYSWFTAFSVLSLAALVRAIRSEAAAAWAAWAVVSAVASYLHYHALLLLVAEAILVILWRARVRRWGLGVAAALAVAIVFLPWVPGLLYQLRHPVEFALDAPDKFPIAQGGWGARAGYLAYAFTLGQTLLPWRPVAVVAGLVLGGLALRGLARPPLTPLAVAALTVAAVSVVAGFAVSQSMPRYYAFLAPLWLGAIAGGWLGLRSRWMRAATALAALTGIALSLGNYYRGRDYHILAPLDPWREVATLVTSGRSGDCLLTMGSYLPVRFYTHEFAGLRPFNMEPAAAADCLEATPEGRLWIVAADKAVTPQVTAAVRALDGRFTRVAEHPFLFDPDAATKSRFFNRPFLDARITVYVYESRKPSALPGSRL